MEQEKYVPDTHYVECGSCGHYHRYDFYGDCREDSERFTSEELEKSCIPYEMILEE